MTNFNENIIEECLYFSTKSLESKRAGVETIVIDRCTHEDTRGRYFSCDPKNNNWCPYFKED